MWFSENVVLIFPRLDHFYILLDPTVLPLWILRYPNMGNVCVS